MTIEQTEQGILIKTNTPIDLKVVQKIVDYVEVMEIVSQAQGTEEQAAELADEVDKKWWNNNKHRFLR